MRVWDIHPGYLNRQSLLGEHRELHGIVSIIKNNRKGYSRHPETLRWIGFGWAIRQRHQLLSAEMALRGYKDITPVRLKTKKDQWPEIFIDKPRLQFDLLKKKYAQKEKGRIPLPETAQELWSHHKYSVMARDVSLYRKIGRTVSVMSPGHDFSRLAEELVTILRKPPSIGGIRNSLYHMWGYVSSSYSGTKQNVNRWAPLRLLAEIQRSAKLIKEEYLLSSTALSELAVWM